MINLRTPTLIAGTRIKVVDPYINNPNQTDKVTVKITSLDTVTRELVQKDLVLYEEGTNSGVFSNAFVYNPPSAAGIWVSPANPGIFSANYFNAKDPAIANYLFSGSIHSPSFLPGWSYRKLHTISGSAWVT